MVGILLLIGLFVAGLIIYICKNIVGIVFGGFVLVFLLIIFFGHGRYRY